MPENKTRPTGESVEQYLAGRCNDDQIRDCRELISLFGTLTGAEPYMWGPSIVGFGTYRYRYESGRTGEAPVLAFAVRGRELVAYLDCESGAQHELLARLGKHKMGKACLYFKRLDDLDRDVLAQLVRASVEAVHARYPDQG